MKQPKTLYLLDDDNDDLDFFCEAVSIIDNTIVCVRATNSEASLKAFRAHDVPIPDLVFVDLNMPLVDGRKFLSEIKMLQPYAHVPVIVCSTSSHLKDKEEARSLGAVDFMTKPHSLDALVNDLAEILSHHWNLHHSVTT